MNISININRNYDNKGETTFLNNIQDFKIECDYQNGKESISFIFFLQNGETRIESFYNLKRGMADDIRQYFTTLLQDAFLEDDILEYFITLTDDDGLFVIFVKHKGKDKKEDVVTFGKINTN